MVDLCNTMCYFKKVYMSQPFLRAQRYFENGGQHGKRKHYFTTK